MKKLMLIIDPQYSFLEVGEFPVKGATAKMDDLAEFVKTNSGDYDAFVMTTDFHPINHCSFVCNGGTWPTHCVQHSIGAAIYDPLLKNVYNTKKKVFTLTKGDISTVEEYSIMDNHQSSKELLRLIEKGEFDEIHVCGIMSRFCVLESIKGLVKSGHKDKIKVLLDFIAHDDNNEELIAYCNENEVTMI